MTELDILAIHKEILEFFDLEKQNINNFKERLILLKKILKSNDLSHSVCQNISKNIIKLENHIEDFSREKSKNFYLMESIPLIEKFF